MKQTIAVHDIETDSPDIDDDLYYYVAVLLISSIGKTSFEKKCETNQWNKLHAFIYERFKYDNSHNVVYSAVRREKCPIRAGIHQEFKYFAKKLHSSTFAFEARDIYASGLQW